MADKDGNVKETNHYYPFGGVFASSQNVQPYKYNGKELDTKKGLNWYDYGARMYVSALGRWHPLHFLHNWQVQNPDTLSPKSPALHDYTKEPY